MAAMDAHVGHASPHTVDTNEVWFSYTGGACA